jgi:hypothetical protein
MLWVGVSTELVLAFLITYVPLFQNFVGTNSFPLINWIFLFALAPLLLVIDELRKWLIRRQS